MRIFSTVKMSKAQLFLGLLAIGFCCLTVADASAQSNRELRNRIDRLEKEIETLSRALFRGEQPQGTSGFAGNGRDAAHASLEVRISQLETELRNMRGKNEELSYDNRLLREELERLKSDFELRLESLEGRGSGAPSVGGAKYINRAPNSDRVGDDLNNRDESRNTGGYQWNSGQLNQGQAAGTLGSYRETSQGIASNEDLAAATYENAFSMLKNEKYDVAQKEFQVFLNEYPDHVLAGNAKYWLGETYYVRGDFETAVRVFAEGFKQYPNNSKTADNLLKLGMSLAALDKPEDACVALAQIQKEGFKASAPVLRRATQEKNKLGCSS
ncbi:MAG: tol-pal system protein YbgF [Bdellovibrionales bacterium]